MEKKHKSFQKKSFYYTPTRSVSLLTSVLNFQTSITDGWRPRMSRYFCLLCNWLRSICWQHFCFVIPDPYDINGQLCQKSITSYRRYVRCQRPNTSCFDFVFPLAFKNKHQFENFFSFLVEGMGTLWFFEFELSQNYRDVTATISHSVSIFLLNASWVTELVNFIFHIMKISNFRHKLAFKQVVRF